MQLDPVDTLIPKSKILKGYLRRGLYILGIIVLIIIGFSGFRNLLKPTLDLGSFETATVELGEVYEIILSTGVLKLKNKYSLLSPLRSTIKRVLFEPGKKVKKGDTILILDNTSIQKDLWEVTQSMEELNNKLNKTILSHRVKNVDYESNIRNLKNRIDKLTLDIQEHETLLGYGAISRSEMTELVDEKAQAREDLETLNTTFQLNKKIQLSEINLLKLERTRLRKTYEETVQLLRKTIIIAPIDGILLSLPGSLGAVVEKEQEIAVISDFNAYKVEGWMEDSFVDRVVAGNEVVIRLPGVITIKGTIGNIRPVVEKGKIYFDVFPEVENHSQFIPNKEVEINIVKNNKAMGLRLPEGAYYKGGKRAEVYKITAGKAVRTSIKIGMVNRNYIEIADGLNEGDEIVTSDVTYLNNMETVEIIDKP